MGFGFKGGFCQGAGHVWSLELRVPSSSEFFCVEGLGFGFGGFEHLGFGGVGATDALNPLKPPAPTQKKARVALNAKP